MILYNSMQDQIMMIIPENQSSILTKFSNGYTVRLSIIPGPRIEFTVFDVIGLYVTSFSLNDTYLESLCDAFDELINECVEIQYIIESAIDHSTILSFHYLDAIDIRIDILDRYPVGDFYKVTLYFNADTLTQFMILAESLLYGRSNYKNYLEYNGIYI